MQIAAVVVAWALTAFLALTYFKAGKFKLTAPMATLAEAGMGWTAKAGEGVTRTIAALELAGAAGIILAPLAAEFVGFSWAQPLGVAAAAGLTAVMVVAIIMHIARGEFKYTYKINLALFAAAAVLTVLLSVYGGKLI